MAKQHIVDPQPEMMSPWYIGSFSQHPSWLFSLERSLSLSLSDKLESLCLVISLPVMPLKLTCTWLPVPHPDFLLLASLAPAQIQENTEIKLDVPSSAVWTQATHYTLQLVVEPITFSWRLSARTTDMVLPHRSWSRALSIRHPCP